ncbi:hypothetical protein ACKI1J_32400 [Streptomyces scabiei]|uniref:Uncharacterized protein n=1 Tax=Streptomyces brasiliscabiei TaxID=2736302 RepID=A0ABU8GPZ8_9ACTN
MATTPARPLVKRELTVTDAPDETETFEGVHPSNVHVGDRLQFMTRETGFNGRGLYVRTGVVVKVTAKTVRVVCGNPTSYKPDTAVLRKDTVEWHSRDVRRIVPEQPARRPYNAENVQYVDDGLIVTAVWCSDPTISPELALENILRRDLPYEVVQIAEATRHFKREGADFSGWIITRGVDSSTEPIARKRDAVEELRGWVDGHFTR